MRIGIDGRELGQQRRGIGRYVWELCRVLDRHMPQAEFIVYSQRPIDLPVDSIRWTLRSDPSALGRRLSPLLWLKVRGSALCRRDRLDVFWATAVFLPHLRPGTRTVVSVYDLCHLLTPETFDPLHLRGVQLFFEADVQRADVVLALSHGTADRLRQHLDREADAVVLPGVGPEFRRVAQQTVERCLQRFGLRQPYLLSVAAWEPRKNLDLLAGAFLDLKREGRLPDHRLVLVGKEARRGMNGLRALLNQRGGDLVSLGYVPDACLPALYTGADTFVLASTYEGFGIPVLEARACGTRVVTTDIPELHEAGGDEATYVEPTRAGIRDGIITSLARVRPPGSSIVSDWEQGGKILAEALANPATAPAGPRPGSGPPPARGG